MVAEGSSETGLGRLLSSAVSGEACFPVGTEHRPARWKDLSDSSMGVLGRGATSSPSLASVLELLDLVDMSGILSPYRAVCDSGRVGLMSVVFWTWPLVVVVPPSSFGRSSPFNSAHCRSLARFHFPTSSSLAAQCTVQHLVPAALASHHN